MIRWEYLTPYIFGDFEKLMAEIGKLGMEGWELVQLQGQCSDGGSRALLKRMIRPPDPPLLVPDGFDTRPGTINRVF